MILANSEDPAEMHHDLANSEDPAEMHHDLANSKDPDEMHHDLTNSEDPAELHHELGNQGLFQQFWEKAPGQNWEKMIDLTSNWEKLTK